MSAKQRFTKIVPGSFNDQAYIDTYEESGEFPKIHKDFGLVVKTYANEAEGSMDLGTCIGIMSVYNVHNGRSNCVGLEGNKFDFDRCVKHPKVKYEQLYVTRDTFPRIKELIADNNITLVTARRVISEVGFDDITVVHDFAKLLADCGVTKIIIQGRAKVKNPSVKLYNSDMEAECFFKYYKITKRWKDVYLLERI